MSSFAPAYHQDSNDAVLNDILADISGRPRIVRDTSSAREEGSHLVDDASSDSTEPPGKYSIWPSQLDLGRLSIWSSRSSNRSGSRNGARSALSSSEARSSNRRNAVVSPIPPSRHSQTSEVKSIEAFDRRSDVQQVNLDALSTLSSPKAVVHPDHTASSRLTIHDDKTKILPRSPVAYGQYLHHSPSLSTIASHSSLQSASQLYKFPPHPSVRPHFQERDVLGEASGPADDDHKYPKPFALFLILLGICLSVFIVSVNRNVVATAVPKITAQFHSYQDIGWYGSAYLLTGSAFQPLYGRVYMKFDTKSVYLVALAIFEAGSLICGLSPTSETLIVGRAIQGLGSAGILTGSFVVGTHSVRLEKRPIVFAGVGMLFGVGALAGPILSGVLVDLASWRWCFYINLPVGGITFVTVMLCFKPLRHSTASKPPFLTRLRQLDWVGNGLVLGACTMLFLALEYSEEGYSWTSARCVGLMVGFGTTLIVFIGWLFWRGPEALIPVRIARQRTVAASCGAAFFIYGALLLQAYYLPIWFQAVKGTSAIRSGVNMVPYMVTNAVFSLFAGVFVSKNGLFTPPAIVGCAIATVGAGLLSTLVPGTPAAKWAGYEVLVSAGLGMAIQQGFSAVQTALPLSDVPVGTAAVVACQSIGGAVFVSVGNTLLQNRLLDASDADAVPGVNIRTVIELGATRFRDVVPADKLPALIALYDGALRHVLIAAVPLCGCAFLCSLCMEWRSVRMRQDTGGMDEKA